MKLVLYSGGHDFENIQLDRHLIDLVATNYPQIAYIPSCSYLCDSDFHDFIKQYEKFNIHNIINFPIDLPYTDVLKNEVLKSDIIHLSGGNTYYFLMINVMFRLFRQSIDFYFCQTLCFALANRCVSR